MTLREVSIVRPWTSGDQSSADVNDLVERVLIRDVDSPMRASIEASRYLSQELVEFMQIDVGEYR